MDQGAAVQDENLVNDQVTQAIADSGVAEAVPVAAPTVPVATPTVPTEPVVPAPAIEEGGAAPEATPLAEPAIEDPAAGPLIEPPATDGALSQPAEETPAAPVVSVMPDHRGVIASGSGDDDELMTVKQQALEQLSPLVDHLDLPADQKFDTYMEILRASDDKSLVQPAFDIAQKIEDEDKKAQALLDVVNEVNYLTQDHEAAE